MNSKQIALAIVVASTLGVAQASVVTSAFGLPVAESLTDIIETGVLNKFNPALGTLTGASLTLFGSGTTTISLTNVSTQSPSSFANSSMGINFTSTLLSLDTVLGVNPEISLLATTGAAQSYASGQTRTFGPLTSAASFTVNLSSILSSLSAAGNYELTCESQSDLTYSGGAKIRGFQDSTGGCGARVTYTYSALSEASTVPEPASLALVMGALAISVGVARRRRVSP